MLSWQYFGFMSNSSYHVLFMVNIMNCQLLLKSWCSMFWQLIIYPTLTKTEAYTSEEVIGRQFIVVPDGQLQGLCVELVKICLPDQGVAPLGVHWPLDDRGFLFSHVLLIRKEVSVDRLIHSLIHAMKQQQAMCTSRILTSVFSLMTENCSFVIDRWQRLRPKLDQIGIKCSVG